MLALVTTQKTLYNSEKKSRHKFVSTFFLLAYKATFFMLIELLFGVIC